ncbi:MAG: L-seryl-tRNA(Sec) selenium transferase [Dehalococcoidia bacterium]|nr:L-seryl-tRNA(Sec) selenium transferase [Dehalococcoidia bacterium]
MSVVRKSNPGRSADARRRLPSVDRLLKEPRVAACAAQVSRDVLVDAVRTVLDGARQEAPADTPLSTEDLLSRVVQRVERIVAPSLRRVVNATGIVLHTNLGRAPLSAATQRAMKEAATGYSNLEYDLSAGERGSRHVHVEGLLCRLTGAEAALVVNNNAAAMLLVLSALAAGREVIVSRGQAVEIGGGFRIPDVLRQSGARLVDVGTTNRTQLADYADAITDDTALLLRVHASNFRIAGFTETVPLSALVRLGRERGVAVADDLGSGCLLDTAAFGLGGELQEPRPQDGVTSGADVSCFSGDKLLGGPQAGLIVGRREPIAVLRSHPLVRALRPDKVTLAGLVATLRHYERGEAEREIPVWQMIGASKEELWLRAQRWAKEIGQRSHVLGVEVRDSESAVGGGSLPGVALPTAVVAIRSGQSSADRLAAALRRAARPVVGRIERDTLMLDPRTVLPDDEPDLLSSVSGL